MGKAKRRKLSNLPWAKTEVVGQGKPSKSLMKLLSMPASNVEERLGNLCRGLTESQQDEFIALTEKLAVYVEEGSLESFAMAEKPNTDPKVFQCLVLVLLLQAEPTKSSRDTPSLERYKVTSRPRGFS